MMKLLLCAVVSLLILAGEVASFAVLPKGARHSVEKFVGGRHDPTTLLQMHQQPWQKEIPRMDTTDKLLQSRIEKEQPIVNDLLFLQILFTLNIVLCWILATHPSPALPEQPSNNNRGMERIQDKTTYEEDVTFLLDSSAGYDFFF